MLVLTRKPEEKIVIGDEAGDNDKIVITILKVQGGKVSIGIQADKKWQIVRQELLDEDANNASEPQGESVECEAVPMELVGASVEK
jgi:carbon storage regulator